MILSGLLVASGELELAYFCHCWAREAAELLMDCFPHGFWWRLSASLGLFFKREGTGDVGYFTVGFGHFWGGFNGFCDG